MVNNMSPKVKRKTEFKSLQISETDKRNLVSISSILGKPQSQIIHEFINAINPTLASFKKNSASLLYDDSDSTTFKMPYEIVIKVIKIDGVGSNPSRLEFGKSEPTAEDEARDNPSKLSNSLLSLR